MKTIKSVNINIKFTLDEWEEFKKYYSDSEIRQILYEGAIGELGQLMSNYTVYNLEELEGEKNGK